MFFFLLKFTEWKKILFSIFGTFWLSHSWQSTISDIPSHIELNDQLNAVFIFFFIHFGSFTSGIGIFENHTKLREIKNVCENLPATFGAFTLFYLFINFSLNGNRKNRVNFKCVHSVFGIWPIDANWAQKSKWNGSRWEEKKPVDVSFYILCEAVNNVMKQKKKQTNVAKVFCFFFNFIISVFFLLGLQALETFVQDPFFFLWVHKHFQFSTISWMTLLNNTLVPAHGYKCVSVSMISGTEPINLCFVALPWIINASSIKNDPWIAARILTIRNSGILPRNPIISMVGHLIAHGSTLRNTIWTIIIYLHIKRSLA